MQRAACTRLVKVLVNFFLNRQSVLGFGWCLKPLYKAVLPGAGTNRPDLTLRKAFGKMRMPSRDEKKEERERAPLLYALREACQGPL
jgi:hypothetical protein